MNFSLSEEHVVLQDAVRSFVGKEVNHETLLIPNATVEDAPYAANWAQIKQLGWNSLIVPEAYGGAGLGTVEMMLVAQEFGRCLFPSPFAGNTFGTWAILHAVDQAVCEDLLPLIAAGELSVALVPPIDGSTVQSVERRLTGKHEFVVDGGSSDRLIVAAQSVDSTWELYLVDSRADGVKMTSQPWRDITREVTAVEFQGVQADLISRDFQSRWPTLHALISLFIAAENVGGLRTVLDTTVDYAKERVAFGRPIGAYQAIKHPLAEMLAAVEGSNTAALYAAWCLDTGDERQLLAASMAKAYSDDAYVEATHRSIQIFGAIGFTWEMKNHLYHKRARGNASLYGDARCHRQEVINLATDRVWRPSFTLGAAGDAKEIAA